MESEIVRVDEAVEVGEGVGFAELNWKLRFGSSEVAERDTGLLRPFILDKDIVLETEEPALRDSEDGLAEMLKSG